MSKVVPRSELCPIHGHMIPAELVGVRHIVFHNRPLGESLAGMLYGWINGATNLRLGPADQGVVEVKYNPATWTFDLTILNPVAGAPTVLPRRPDMSECTCGQPVPEQGA